MPESRDQPSDLPKDPVRVVYHTGNRTFARLFNEHSLEEVRDVVRRKLGLGRKTDVSLKQIRPDALLDLEDDDDFQAFCVLLKSSVSADIQVTVGESEGAPVPTALPATEPPIAPLTPRSKEPAASATVVQSSARPESPSERSPAARTPSTSFHKRRVSFGDAPTATFDGAAERRPTADTPVSSSKVSKTVETPSTPKGAGPEEPPKKKRKKEIVKAKDTEGAESASAKASSKHKVKKSAALAHGSEAGASTPKDTKTSESAAKRPKRQKKDEGTVSKQSFALDPDSADQPITQPSIPVNDTSVQLGEPKGSVSKSRQLEKTIGVCASIPRTSASASVQSEVAAAIWSDYLSKGSETTPPAPPPKRKSVRRDSKKSSATSSALLTKSTTVSQPPDGGLPNVLAEPSPGHVAPTHELPQHTHGLNGPPCPICLAESFHIRYRCPIVLRGPDAIRERLDEVKRMNAGDQHALIKELEGLLRDSEVPTEPSSAPHGDQSRETLQPLSISVSRTPNIPRNSHLSEVTVESRDEGSSSDSSDDVPVVKHEKRLPGSGKRKTTDKLPSPSNDDLEAVMRGPALKQQSVLQALAHILVSEDDSDSEEDEAELEEDLDEENGRSPVRSSKRVTRSSDTESEEEESRSSSPSQDRPEPGVSGSNKPAEEPTEHRGDDVVMKDGIDPPVLGGRDDDSSEETQIGSEDPMVVDDPTGGKGTAAVVEGQISLALKPSDLHPSNASGNERQERGEPQVDTPANANGIAPAASRVLGGTDTDPIEPADDPEPPTNSPIEAPSEVTGPLSTGVAQSTPQPGVTRRIRTRNGQTLDDKVERPVRLQQLTSGATGAVTPLPTKAKSRRKAAEISASQEPATTRRSPRFNSLPPAASTPAAVTLLSHRTKAGARSSKATKTPAKQSEEGQANGSQSSIKDGDARNGVRLAPTRSLNRWETLGEPSSPSLQPDEPSVQLDELMPSSPRLDDNPIHMTLSASKKTSGLLKFALSGAIETPQGRERLFDPSSSQIPFPYSQHKSNPAPTTVPDGKETTDSEEEPRPTKKRARLPVRYRSLSQLASQAALFPPSLPTPANKSMTDGKAKKRVKINNPSSSSSSSDEDEDEDEAGGSEHIPPARRAGSVPDTRRKKKNPLLTM